LIKWRESDYWNTISSKEASGNVRRSERLMNKTPSPDKKKKATTSLEGNAWLTYRRNSPI